MRCKRCGRPSTAADDLCARCRWLRRVIEAREKDPTPDYKQRAAGDA